MKFSAAFVPAVIAIAAIFICGYQILLSIRSHEARQLAEHLCVAKNVIEVRNARELGRVSAAFSDEDYEDRETYRIYSEKPKWLPDKANSALLRSHVSVYENGNLLFEVNDVAVTPQNIVTELGFLQPSISFHCLPLLDDDTARIFYNFSQAH